MRKIVVHPDVCNGQPTFEGTRITVQSVLEFLGAGDSPADVAREYPSLSEADILEALKFSSRLMRHQFLVRDVA